MSTAIYIEGALIDEKLLFSFGDGVEMEDMFHDIMDAITEQRFTMVSSFIVTSSEYLDVDLEQMMFDIREQMFLS